MNQTSIQQLLQKFTLFKNLTDEEVAPIVDLAKNRRYQKGAHVFMQDDPLKNVYFIYEGRVKIYRTDVHGKEQIINVLQPGSMFPHQGFFRNDNYPAHAEIMEDALLIYIPIHLFEQFLINHPEVCVKLFRVLGDLIVDLQNRLEEKMMHNTYEQIILLLLRLGKQSGEKVTEAGYIKLATHFTNRELANMIGSSRETVSRTLAHLKKKNYVMTDASGLLILDEMMLQNELF